MKELGTKSKSPLDVDYEFDNHDQIKKKLEGVDVILDKLSKDSKTTAAKFLRDKGLNWSFKLDGANYKNTLLELRTEYATQQKESEMPFEKDGFISKIEKLKEEELILLKECNNSVARMLLMTMNATSLKDFIYFKIESDDEFYEMYFKRIN